MNRTTERPRGKIEKFTLGILMSRRVLTRPRPDATVASCYREMVIAISFSSTRRLRDSNLGFFFDSIIDPGY